MSDRRPRASGPCMKPPALVVDFSADDDEHPSRASSFSDFEDVSYPPSYFAQRDQPRSHHHHTDDTLQLPLHHTYMSAVSTTANEDIAARRRLKHPPHDPGYTYVGEKGESLDDPLYYDDEGKDVYSKLQRPRVGRMGSGRLPQRPPPPPTSLVRILSHSCSKFHLTRSDRKNLYIKTSTCSSPSSTPFSRVIRVSTKLAPPTSLYGMKPTLASLGRITSSASFTLMCTRPLGR